MRHAPCAGSFHADASALPCGLYAVAVSGNGQEFDDVPFSVFVHGPVVVASITPPCVSIDGGTAVTVALSQMLHASACKPLVMLSSCDAPIPAKFSPDGLSVSFTAPAAARASAGNTLKFSANGGCTWSAAAALPQFGQ